jgi:hypothetical protein
MKCFLIIAALAFTSLTLTSPVLLADARLNLQKGDTIATILERNRGEKVELRLKSGEKIGGKVDSVQDKLVYLSEVSGMENFDAVVDTTDISAVVARKH